MSQGNDSTSWPSSTNGETVYIGQYIHPVQPGGTKGEIAKHGSTAHTPSTAKSRQYNA